VTSSGTGAERLARRYGELVDVVVRGGRAYPAALEPSHRPDPEQAVVLGRGEATVDPTLREAGASHLERVLDRNPETFDGTVLALEHVRDGVVHVVRATYFDMLATCDVLQTGDADWTLREQAERLADGNPLRSGRGRAAAVGSTVVVVRTLADGRSGFTLGRRSDHLPVDPGQWHVVASGTIDGRGLMGTLADELRDEHGVQDPGRVLDGARVIGLGYDLPRMRPEVVVVTQHQGQIPRPEPSNEFAELRDVPLDSASLAAVWAELGPERLTAAGVVALAAIEREFAI
jgi:hypothetical protein